MPTPPPPLASAFAADLLARRQSLAFGLQLKQSAQQFTDELLAVLFPHFCRETYFTSQEIEAKLALLERDLKRMIGPLIGERASKENAARAFFDALPAIHTALLLDAEAINAGDPAAESLDEVILAYPGFTAIAIHRLAHELYRLRVPIFPRLLSEYAHQVTGIDIHPGATVGQSFAIDHGTGIVIGESAVIGRNVKIYQGVTLGALSVRKDLASTKRHPTIEDNVVIYAQAVILGGDTVVGHDSVIGGNAWLTHSVPPHSVVVQESETTVRPKDPNGDDAIYFI
ncbi:MAG: serine acetyltransferase [Gemmatimonadaceae bacterium]|nr:serine acetyltransferase [Gemmatimonadaceae bacterium]